MGLTEAQSNMQDALDAPTGAHQRSQTELVPLMQAKVAAQSAWTLQLEPSVALPLCAQSN